MLVELADDLTLSEVQDFIENNKHFLKEIKFEKHKEFCSLTGINYLDSSKV